MKENLILSISIVLGSLLLIWLIARLYGTWRIFSEKNIDETIAKYAGTDKFFNIFLKEEEGLDTKTIVACKIINSPLPGKVLIAIPDGDSIYRLGYSFEKEEYDLTVSNIKRIRPYESAEIYIPPKVQS